MKFENAQTSNWQNAFRGLRNPMNSHAKSDSVFGLAVEKSNPELSRMAELWMNQNETPAPEMNEIYTDWLREAGTIHRDNDLIEYAYLGPVDLSLAQRMIKGGTPNDKFLRQIGVSIDITAPLFWWKEADTYKVSTTANSCSTMHKIASKEILLDNFEIDDYNPEVCFDIPGQHNFIDSLITFLEDLRTKYIETKDKRYWKELIRWLPEGWLQKRTWTANYAVLRAIIRQRQTHKLSEWRSFIEFLHTLPWADELLFYCNEPGINA